MPYLNVEDLAVYQKLCQLHINVCDLTHQWPREEIYELGSQGRRASNNSPAQLAEKNDDRHVRNKIEGGNRSRGEAVETIHHLYIAKMKEYISDANYMGFRERYKQWIRMLNGLEKKLEIKLPDSDRRWKHHDIPEPYKINNSSHSFVRPPTPEPFDQSISLHIRSD